VLLAGGIRLTTVGMVAGKPQMRASVTPSQSRFTPRKKSLERREVSLTYRQVAFVWVCLGVVMGLTFFFGLFAGRKQGVELALEERGSAMVRLPVGGALGEEARPGSTVVNPSEVPAEPFDFGSSQVIAGDRAQLNLPQPAVKPGAPLTANRDGAPLPVRPAMGGQSNHPPLSQPRAPVQLKLAPTQGAARTVSTLAPVKSTSVKPTPVKPSPPQAQWVVQVAAPKQQGEAEEIAKRLRGRGVGASVERVTVNKTTYFRVVTKGVPAKQDAERLKAQVERLGVVKERAVVRPAG